MTDTTSEPTGQKDVASASPPPTVASLPIDAQAQPTAEPLAEPGSSRFLQEKLIEGKVIEALREIFDPEIPVNIYELGLIYGIKVLPDDSVEVKMTLTSPGCPVAGSLPGQVETRVEAVPEVKSAKVELVWDPPWSKDRMSEGAMLQLGFM
jgi:FeS assembly SUF system protein